MKTDKIKTLHLIQDKYLSMNEEIKNLNRGGCGIFAECLYNALTSIGIKAELIIATDDREAVEINVKNNVQDASNLIHVLVAVDDYLLDSHGIYARKTFSQESKYYGRYERVSFPIEMLTAMNKKVHFWNPTFNRQQIPEIKKKFKNIIKELKK